MIFTPQPDGRRAVPIPAQLPGDFFVVEFERDSRDYVLHVDDDERSTYVLGPDPTVASRVFTARGYRESSVHDLIDRAREFGACQYIPSGFPNVADRTIQLTPRRVPVTLLFDRERQPNVHWQNL